MHGDRRFLRFFVEPSPEIVKALEKGEDVFEVCTKRGRLAMLPLEIGLTTADRTDALGQFTVEARLLSQSGKEIRFASADFSREAIVVVHADDPDRPLDITLLPVRPVRARVAVKPKNDPQEELVWHVYRVDPLAGKLDRIPMFGSSGAFLQTGVIGAQPGPAGQKRWIEPRLTRGHYKIAFESDTLHRMVDIVVPAGEGLVELPEIALEQSAWYQRLGKPAPEIEGVDIEGKPVDLAEYRGKVIALVFWSSTYEPDFHFLARLAELGKRFKGQPLVILALHDASLRSLETFRNAVEPLRKTLPAELPIRFLLDRAPINKSAVRRSPDAGEIGSGRTADIYESYDGFSTFVIDKNGSLVFAAGPGWYGLKTFSVAKDGQVQNNHRDLAQSSDVKVVIDAELASLMPALENRWDCRARRFRTRSQPDRRRVAPND